MVGLYRFRVTKKTMPSVPIMALGAVAFTILLLQSVAATNKQQGKKTS